MAEQRDPEKSKVDPSQVEAQVDLDFELINEAFRYEIGDALDLEKQIRSAAFLLESCSNMGNEDLDGDVANGLAQVLKDAAASVRMLGKRVEKLEEKIEELEADEAD